MNKMPSLPAALEPAAGFTLESQPGARDRATLAKGEYSVASRALALSTYFLSGALAINVSQVLGAPLYLVNEDWYNAWIAFTKQSFGLLTMTLTQTFAPTKVVISGDASVRGQLFQARDGTLVLDFPERLVLVANHQIYTDWLYLWWIAYCNGVHGRLYIILKESLKKIPVLGWGMQLSQFIFLKRNWERDKPSMATALQKLNRPTDPMWLLLFPEGTNLAPSTRAKSAAWAAKIGIPDTRHVLLPRSTGLQFCLQELRGSVDYLYDCTVAYEGVALGQYAQDIFTLKAGYLQGRPPKSVNMHWRRFALGDIPLHDDKAFAAWLTARWREKDVLLERYHTTGAFPADTGAVRYSSGKVVRGCGHLEVPIRASHWYEFLQIFAPMGILATILYVFYGDLSQRLWKSINKQALLSRTGDLKQAGIKAGTEAKNLPSRLDGLTLDSFFDPSNQQETFNAGAQWVQRLLNSPKGQAALDSAGSIQQFMSDPQKTVETRMAEQQHTFLQDLAREEARRHTDRGSTDMVKRAGAAPVPKTVALSDQARPGESSRHVSTSSGPPIAQPKGAFWEDLQARERASIARPKGTFWEDLQARERERDPPATATANRAPKPLFWDALRAEENSRHATVVTLSSNASTAVASVSSRSKSVNGAEPTPRLGTATAKKATPAARSAGTVKTVSTRPAPKPLRPLAANVSQAGGPQWPVAPKRGAPKVPPSAAGNGVASTPKPKSQVPAGASQMSEKRTMATKKPTPSKMPGAKQPSAGLSASKAGPQPTTTRPPTTRSATATSLKQPPRLSVSKKTNAPAAKPSVGTAAPTKSSPGTRTVPRTGGSSGVTSSTIKAAAPAKSLPAANKVPVGSQISRTKNTKGTTAKMSTPTVKPTKLAPKPPSKSSAIR